MKTCRECEFVGEDSLFVKGENWCKNCKALYNKEYQENHTDKFNERSKEWYANHKDERKEYMKINKIRILEQKKDYRDNNKDKISKQQKEYCRNDIPKYLHKLAKGRANKKGIEFTITIQDIIDVMPKDNVCHLLNIKMQYNEGKSAYNSFSLDRIDNSKGYIPGNIQVISWRANKLKSDSTFQEIELLYKHWNNQRHS